jgi:nicotinate dehydrogenase subunit A
VLRRNAEIHAAPSCQPKWRGLHWISPHPTLAEENAMATPLTLNVNGKPRTLRVDDPEMPLLLALRNDLDLHGPRFGCGLAQCGSCTVHVDGEAVRSCRFPVSKAAGRKIVTLEGLGTPGKLHPLQQAFIDEQAVQCGYCINGMIMQAAAFLRTNKRPSEDDIRQALAGNLCRCGTHVRIVRAVKRASEMMA